MKAHAKAVVHMRERHKSRALGLVLGAGVSKAVQFPSWPELVQRIADDEEVDGGHLLAAAGSTTSDTAKTQMLLQHYRTKRLDALGEPASSKTLRKIHGEWRRIMQRALYQGVPTTAQELRNCHPYLNEFIPVIIDSPMTVTYNFDDTVERLIRIAHPDREGNFGRSFETVWNAALQFRSGTAVIYHPNGFLPHNLLEYPSETIVFSEDTFADQLIESMAGHHASLLHHLSKTTCIFVGLSLNDTTLRHLLRQNARINPGHCHYYVAFVEDGIERDRVVEQSLRDANFEVYNLITLFLTNSEIAALGKLITAEDDEFRLAAEEEGAELRYVYYLSGAIGAGKTTSLSYLNSLKTYEEWTETRIELLGKAWTELTESERVEVDGWILGQFVKKNVALLNQSSGILVVDRPALDPLSFTPPESIPLKASAMRSAFAPGASRRRICTGQVILMKGEPGEMEARVVGRHKESSASVIREMQEKLTWIYPNHCLIDTFGASVHDVVRAISRIIHLEDYAPSDLAARLDELADG
ncbi:MAG: SIR2 family protein [Sphingomonadaceae bacterium]|nr:SIR2 family protein [Sphingomonadaceae bacterium]